jgi:hypothetical protein
VAEAQAEGLEHRGRQRRRAGDEEPHRLAQPAGVVLRPLEQADVHGRHAEEERRPELLEERQRPLGLEAHDQAHAAPAREPRADAVAEAVDVEERQHGEVAVVRADPPGLDERAAFAARLPWRSTAPLARPVVPEVETIAAGEEPSSRACGPRAAAATCAASAASAAASHTRTPAGSPVATPALATKACGSASATMWPTSRSR